MKPKFNLIFGNNTETRILELILSFNSAKKGLYRDFKIKQIRDEIKGATELTYGLIYYLLDCNILEKSKKINQVQYYQLNKKNKIAKMLINLYSELELK